MGPKRVICNICRREVSKRSTLAFEGGRACRDHEEVIQKIQKINEDLKLKRGIEESILIPALVMSFRILLSAGAPMLVLEDRLKRLRGQYGEGILRKVMGEVLNKGLITEGEIMSAVLMGRVLNGRTLKGAENA